MPSRSRILPAQPDATLPESDVRGIVRLLGEVAASRKDHIAMKQRLMEGLSRLIKADSWIWSLGCEVEPGTQPTYLSMAHGGFDEERYASLLCAAAHPDMAWLSIALVGDMRKKQSHVTRLRQHIAPDKVFVATGVDANLRAADIGPFILSLRPIDERSVSTIGLYRRRDDPPFTERESRIAHIVLSEIPWLHEQGWPEDRGATVPRLPPRSRLVLNMLLEGRSRKEIASSLSISENTVAGYQKAIYSHFGVNSQPALMRRFQLGDGGDS